jgi:hypothetical protein
MAIPVEPDEPLEPDAPPSQSGDWAAIAGFSGGVTPYKPVNFAGLVDDGVIDLAGSYTIVSVTTNQIVLSNPNIVNPDWDDLTEATDYSSPSLNTTGEVWVGWFDIDALNMDKVAFNVIAPQGMYGINKAGEQIARAETAYIEMVPIAKDGTVLGAVETFTQTLTGSAVEKEQVAMTIMATPATGYRYKARMKRSTPTDLNPKHQAVDEMKWESCYGLSTVTQDHFGNVTTVFTRTYATQSATAVKERRFNLQATRLISEWNGTTFVGMEPQTSAAPIICAMALDAYIGNRSIEELNVAQIYAEIEALTDYFGIDEATQFNYTFDDDNISFEESVQTVAQSVFSTAYRLGNVLHLYGEMATETSLLLFNHRNKLPKSETRTVTFGPTNDYDGVELTYVDPKDDVVQTIYLPDDQSARNPKKIETVGIRNEPQAMLHAHRAYNKIIYQNTTTQFDCLEEAEYLINNNRILVADNTRSDTKDGHVKGQIGLVLQLSQSFVGIPGTVYTIFLQHTDGTVEAIECEPGADQWQVVLSEAPARPLSLGDEQSVVAQYWIVGDNEPRASAFLMSEKEPSSKNTYSITAINYDARYYQDDRNFAIITADATFRTADNVNVTADGSQ